MPKLMLSVASIIGNKIKPKTSLNYDYEEIKLYRRIKRLVRRIRMYSALSTDVYDRWIYWLEMSARSGVEPA